MIPLPEFPGALYGPATNTAQATTELPVTTVIRLRQSHMKVTVRRGLFPVFPHSASSFWNAATLAARHCDSIPLSPVWGYYRLHCHGIPPLGRAPPFLLHKY